MTDTDTIDMFLGEMRCALHRFQPKPGDVFILTAPGQISQEQAMRIQANWKGHYPDFALKLAILTDGMTVELVSAAEQANQ